MSPYSSPNIALDILTVVLIAILLTPYKDAWAFIVFCKKDVMEY